MTECKLAVVMRKLHPFAESEGGGLVRQAEAIVAPDSGAARGLIMPTKLCTICEIAYTSSRHGPKQSGQSLEYSCRSAEKRLQWRACSRSDRNPTRALLSGPTK